VSVDDAIAQKPDYALFSAGATTSRTYAKRFVEVGTTVIDNSSAWRKDNDVPLVVPEVNFSAVKDADKLIANPNCSTIQMVLALSQLHLRYTIKRLVISTYQSVTGTGVKAIRQMEGEEQGVENIDMVYPYPIHRNLFPHGGDFQVDGYTTEEQKLVDETRKILADDAIAITATVVRVPVMGGHSESINIEFANDYDIADVFETLRNTEGVTVLDDVQNNVYPMPLYAKGKDDVFVGRIRRDASQPKSLNIWVVSDNIRKGAATNAVQIMQHLINR
jgi:aspartate-semialdehyde dehydrogenase